MKSRALIILTVFIAVLLLVPALLFAEAADEENFRIPIYERPEDKANPDLTYDMLVEIKSNLSNFLASTRNSLGISRESGDVEKFRIERKNVLIQLIEEYMRLTEMGIPDENNLIYPKCYVYNVLPLSGPLFEEDMRRHEAQMKEYYRVRKIEEIINLKEMLKHQILGLYNGKPYIYSEYREVLKETLKDDALAEKFFSEAKESIGPELVDFWMKREAKEGEKTSGINAP